MKKIKNYLIVLSIILGTIIACSYFIIKNNSLNSGISKEIYLKNNSWNTDFLSSVPYKKNDELEVFLVLKTNKSKSGKLNYTDISKKINISKILIDDKEISKDDNLNLDDSTGIKIIGKAKSNGVLKNDDLIIDFNENQNNKSENKVDEVKKEETVLKTSDIKIYFSKYSLNSNTNNLIEITGSGINQIKYVNIGGHSLKPITDNNKVYLSIDKNTFDNGGYFVIIQTNNDDLITLDEKLYFEFDDNKVNITNITPNKLVKGTDKNIVIQGNGFLKIVSIQLNNNIILNDANFQIVSDKVVILKIPNDINIGTYYLNIMCTDKIYEIKNKNFIISN